jgi:hypothetical protein
MKKIFLSAIAVMAIGTAAQAQDINFGAKAGVNFASMSIDPEGDMDLKSRTGLHIGVLAEFKITETFAVQPEILYSMQGYKAEFGDVEVETKADYLIIPIMAKYFVTEGLSIEAGPQVGFLMSAKDDDGEDIKDGYKSIDFGINGGLGYELPMGVFFQARYYVGLSNIAEETDLGEADVEYKNNVFALSVGYKF